jgi:phytoene synthase
MTLLDTDYIKRAAPPGSMRYFALLYTPSQQRELLTALFVIDAEIRASATQVAHEVAHTRLQWWRAEIDRLINRNAQHPATQAVQAALSDADFSVLYELLVAADMDLARMTYNNAAELGGYLERSGGVIFELLGHSLDTDSRRSARKLGALIRRVETIRDLVAEARAGRIYWPLAEMDAKQVTAEQWHSTQPPSAVYGLLATEITRLHAEFARCGSTSEQPALRPLRVLAALHGRLLVRIERSKYDVFTQRHELGPLEKVWTAWRGARKS